MKHSRKYLRDQDYRHAIRRRNLDRALSSYLFGDWYNNLHQYSKNKIHCSCGLCSCKTNGSRARRHGVKTMEPAENWSMKDKKRIDEMEEQVEELEEDYDSDY